MAGIVKSRELVKITGFRNSGPYTAALSVVDDASQAVPISISWKANQNPNFNFWRDNSFKIEIFDDGGTPTVRLTNTGQTPFYSRDAYIEVVQFVDAINVQQVDADMASAAASATITIADVGSQSSAFFLHSSHINADTDLGSDGHIFAEFNGASTTEINLHRGYDLTPVGSVDGTLYVVDCDSGEFTVDHVTATFAATALFSVDVTVATTVEADSFILSHYESGENSDEMRDWIWQASLVDPTTVQVDRSVGGSGTTTDLKINIQVVEGQNSEWDVQRAFPSIASSADETKDTSITAVSDLSFSAVVQGGHYSAPTSCGKSNSVVAGEIDNMALAHELTSTTNLRSIHRDYRRAQTAYVEIVEFAEATAPSGVDGDIAVTESADTPIFSGGVLVGGQVAATEVADTATISSQVLIAGQLAATESADSGAFSGQILVQGSIATTEAADIGAFSGVSQTTGTIAATEAADGADFLGGEPITNQYWQMHVKANEQSGLDLTNFAGMISTPEFLPSDAWDNYDGSAFRASVRIGAVNFNHSSGTSLPLMRPKYSGHPNKTLGQQLTPGDSAFTAVMFSVESTPGVSFAIYEVGSDPSFSTLGKQSANRIQISVGDNGRGSPDQPYVEANAVEAFLDTQDGQRRIYGLAVHAERDTQFPGDAIKVWWADYEFATDGTVIQSRHGQTFLETDSRMTTDGTPIDDQVDLAVIAITGSLESELYGWGHANYPYGFRPDFESSQELHDQAGLVFDAWGRGTSKKLPAEWLDIADRRRTATLAASEAADTATFSGEGAPITGSIAATEGADTAAFSGEILVEAVLTVSEQADTADLDGSILAQAELVAVEAADSANFSAINITSGELTIVEAADGATFSGASTVTGSLTATQAADTADFSGLVIGTTVGVLAIVEAADGVALTGPIPTRGAAITPAALQSYLGQRFVDYWAGRSEIVWDNVIGTSTPFVRFTIRHSGFGEAAELGSTRRFRRFGTVFVQVFTSVGSGTETANELTEAAAGFFATLGPAPGGFFFGPSVSDEIGPDSRYYQTNISAPFTYDTVRGGPPLALP